jgi:Bacteriophage tail sheath protein
VAAVVEILYPGVYVEEVPFGVAPIIGVSTSTAAFVGEAATGDRSAVVNVKSHADFKRAFGCLRRDSELGAAVSQFFANGGSEAWVAGVPRGTPLSEGLQRLDAVDTLNLVCLPGETELDALRAVLEYAERRRAFVLIDPPGADLDRTMAFAKALAGSGSANGAVYFPPIQVDGAATDTIACPPSGAVAGMYARHDRARGVWKAPEGVHAALPGVVAPVIELDDDAISRLSAAGVNSIRRFPGGGIRVWGSRTLLGAGATTSEWKYVPVRRLALFIEESLYRGIQWAVFEPNDEPSWAKLRTQIAVFLDALFRAGALQGRRADEAYFVRCGRETMSQNDLDSGLVRIVIGFAPLKPAEFVDITIGQWTSKVCTESFDATGRPCERLRLRHHPVAAEGVFLQVADAGAWTTWTEVTQLHDSGPGERVYTLDRDAGELVFGDGEHGASLPVGGQTVRATYRYGTGRGRE